MKMVTKSRLLRTIGSILIFVGGMVALSPRISNVFQLQLPLDQLGYLAIVGIALAGFGVKTLRYGKQLVAKDANAVRVEDPRAPVLYLRPFAIDSVLSRPIGSDSSPTSTSQEEDLVEALCDYGPVVAIGRPGEPLPTLGAARMYVDDDHWKERVSDLLAESSLIVLVTGDSPGLIWEVAQTVELGKPSSLILFITNSKSTYAAYVAMTSHLFPEQLPPIDIVFKRWGFIDRMLGVQIRAVVTFDDNWRPVLKPVSFQWKFWKYTKPTCRGAFTPSVRAALRTSVTATV
jgi:hypothetical protein